MKTYNILFLCTHNSARSVLGEALASTHPSGKFIGYSAGSTPGTSVNPIAADLAAEMGMDRTLLKSKSWDVFGQPDAPKMDFIITVCDNAAGEQCPFWPGQPATAHWGFPDPSQVQGSDIEKKAAFVEVMNGLKKRLDILAAMPLEKLDSMSLKEIHQKA
ncbi:MAG: protein-tyrosine-phosphatase [Polynucleobacter sp. 17-46-58]|jgi:protein-tyrosine-phosphatase|nr:MAG: protein-tyrosine-phosphatase [Polynucleobacter sp. 17-46-58]HQR84111.1 arsenate reductase ArsC [Polynucleobacter sp.]HQS61236.1 arsenate reductase ArsC [Polynucleobacter sp.]HQT20481.1 arsenate reductase ArsC [Polynucleobacter sp.]HQT41189.1 arsenate reductase ArsC [Polynucleobacter sp.]